jgi:hypothetical protein
MWERFGRRQWGVSMTGIPVYEPHSRITRGRRGGGSTTESDKGFYTGSVTASVPCFAGSHRRFSEITDKVANRLIAYDLIGSLNDGVVSL